MTTAERQRAHNVKRREAGRVPLTVWVSERVRSDLRDVITAADNVEGEIVGLVIRNRLGRVKTVTVK